jgi:hypothetical protein
VNQGLNQPTCRSRYVFYQLVCYHYTVVIINAHRAEEIQKLILNVVIPKVNQLNVAIIWWYSNFLI